MRLNLFNSQNPNGPRLPITIDILHQDLNHTLDGELVYILQFTTNIKTINPVVIYNVTETSIYQEIQNGLVDIASQLDWGNILVDIKSPAIEMLSPKDNEQNVSISSSVIIQLVDRFPTSLIDPSTIKIKANGIDISNSLEIKSKNQFINITWNPIKILD